jgi:tetratricopeptide (TPR) repeat protein
MEEGRGHRAEGDPEKFLELFTAAVTLFRKAGQLGNAAFCLEEMNQLEKAGDIWVTIGQHEKAASLFMACGAWRKAYETYDLIESYAEAARALRQGELFDELAIYLVKYICPSPPSSRCRV